MNILEKLIKEKWMEYKMDKDAKYDHHYYIPNNKDECKKRLNIMLHHKNMKRIKDWLKPTTKKWIYWLD